MPKFRCECGNVIGLGEIPSPNQWLIISDVDYDKYKGLIDAEEIFMEMEIVAKCKECDRLYIFWDGFGNAPKIYKPEY